MTSARRSIVACLAVLCLLAGSATALGAQHQSAYSLQPNFMCVSCHEPLNQVNSPEALAEKQTLVQLVDKGLSYTAIKAQMVSIYGEEVLAEPPAHGVSLLVYILPPLVLIGGLGLLAYNLPRWRRRARVAEAAGAGPTGPPLDRADAQRLEHELADFDR
jgi:cytochrome c-type biogenesis protein CcmH/NrfF